MLARRLLIALALVLPFACAAPASAYVYWGDPSAGTIGRANLDGSAATDAFIAIGGRPTAVAVNGSHIYWANETAGTIGRANINGSEVEPNLITGLKAPDGIALTSTQVFWSDSTTDRIGSANLDGSGKLPNLITTEGPPCGVAVDSGSVYWTDNVSFETFIGRAAFNGGSVKPKLAELGINLICGMAVNSANIFWTAPGLTNNGTEIGRANTSDGGAVNPSLIGTADGPCGIALAGTQMYWANSGNGTIGRANTDGTAVDEELVHTGGGAICGVAVDSLSTPPAQPPVPPSLPATPPPATPLAGTMRLVKLKGEPKKGRARVVVAVNQAGTISVTGKAVDSTKATARGPGSVTILVKDLVEKRRARRGGPVTMKLALVFAPSDGGASADLARSVTLREHPAHK